MRILSCDTRSGREQGIQKTSGKTEVRYFCVAMLRLRAGLKEKNNHLHPRTQLGAFWANTQDKVATALVCCYPYSHDTLLDQNHPREVRRSLGFFITLLVVPFF